jgi:hypothetical protein
MPEVACYGTTGEDKESGRYASSWMNQCNTVSNEQNNIIKQNKKNYLLQDDMFLL